jgi:hypothetical protein
MHSDTTVHTGVGRRSSSNLVVGLNACVMTKMVEIMKAAGIFHNDFFFPDVGG